MPEDEFNLIATARGYFANDFPNPTATGCPSRAVLSELSDAKSLPDSALRAHLLSCSACFEYLNARLVSRPAEIARPALWRRVAATLASAWQPLTVAALLSVLCLGFWALRHYLTSSPATIIQSPSPTAEEASTHDIGNSQAPSLTATPAPGTVAEHTSNRQGINNSRAGGAKPAAAEVYLVKIDLSARRVLRGVDDAAGYKVISVPSTDNRLAITLPKDSQVGEYTVSLVDAFGQTLIARKTRSRDGKYISLRMDMRGLPSRKYRLCISQADGAPSCFPLFLTSRR